MNNLFKKESKHGKIAVMQIMLMIVSIVAGGYLIGGINRVSGNDDESKLLEFRDTTPEELREIVGVLANQVRGGSSPAALTTPSNIRGITLFPSIGTTYRATGTLRDADNKILVPEGGSVVVKGGKYNVYKKNGEIYKDNPLLTKDQINEMQKKNLIGGSSSRLTSSNLEALGKRDWNSAAQGSYTFDDKTLTNAYTETFNGVKYVESEGKYYKVGSDGKLTEAGFTKKDDKFIKTPKQPAKLSGGARFGNSLTTGLKWGFTVYTSIAMLGPMLGLDTEETQAYSLALGVGSMVAGFVYGASPTKEVSTGRGWAAAIVGIAVAYLTYVLNYEEKEYRQVTFNCEPWQAPVGGEFCEACNNRNLPCGEYQCRSLGQACELLNEGTDDEACAWVNRQDVKEPIITPNLNALLDGHTFTPITGAPNESGTILSDTSNVKGCIGAFIPFKFGITTDELSRCKVDTKRKATINDMRFFIDGSSTFKYNHSQTISLPRTGNGTIELKNDGNFELFLRCEDANGNANVAEFVIKYCVEPGPDTTAPQIIGTEFGNNKPIVFDAKNLSTKIFTNEEAECRWSKDDKDYDDMLHNMTDCGDSNGDPVANQPAYSCNAFFPGIKNEVLNKFYIKCKDNLKAPLNESNVNVQSFEFNIIGTRPLAIDYANPNGTTIKDSPDSVKVTLEIGTIAGYSEGNSICSSSSQENDGFVPFLNTNSYIHTTDLYLTEGTYEYWVRCVDLGGNSDKTKLTFDVDSDSAEPEVVRVYKEELNLRISTDEIASCVYNTKDCTYLFEDGIVMTKTVDEMGHYTEWNPQTKFYIKCRDDFNNKPSPDECSIIIKPLEK